MECAKLNLAEPQNVNDAHVAASASRPTGSVFTRRRAGTSYLFFFVSSCYVTFSGALRKIKRPQQIQKVKMIRTVRQVKMKGLNLSPSMFDVGAHIKM